MFSNPDIEIIPFEDVPLDRDIGLAFEQRIGHRRGN